MKRLLISLITVLLIATLLICLVLSQKNKDKCLTHKDFNGDLKCDVCNENVPEPENPDGSEMPTIPCDVCADENSDEICDLCGKSLVNSLPPENAEAPNTPCDNCTDENGDGSCDVCNKAIEPTPPEITEPPNTPCDNCTDGNGDGTCDACGEKITVPDETFISVTVNGTDVRNHVIAYDSTHSENELLAIMIRDALYEIIGARLNILDVSELRNESYIAVKSSAVSGGDGFYAKIKNSSLEIICEYPNQTVSAGEKYLTQIFENTSERVAFTEASINVRDIFYKDFGAIGDGKTNDYIAIKEAHDYANQYGHTVLAEKKAVYYIASVSETIKISTNVNWFDATFIIDDRDIASASSKVLFTVTSDYKVKEFDTQSDYVKAITGSGGLSSDTERIDLSLGYPALLIIENSNHKNSVLSTEKEPLLLLQKEIIVIDENGFISRDTPITLDYTELTFITAYRIDDSPITLNGGTFVRKANGEICDGTFYSGIISVRRSNVTVEYLRYEITDESESPYLTNPCEPFLSIENANNVKVSNCTVAAHKISRLQGSDKEFESYVFEIKSSGNVEFYNCFQSNFYSLDGETPNYELSGTVIAEHSKNISFIGSTFLKIVAHSGICNVSLVSCAVSSIDTVGAGTLLIEKTYVYGDVLLILSEEYGSYWNGDMIIKDSFLLCENEPTLIGGAWYNHDFGYVTALPESILIDNLFLSNCTEITVFDSRIAISSENIPSDEVDGEKNLNKMLPPKSITIKNNTVGYSFFIPDTEYFKNTIITED